MFERRLYFHVDWLLLTVILLIAGIEIAMIYSTTYVTLPDGSGHAGPQVRTQVYALVIGLVAFLICLTLDYRMLAEHSLVPYGGLLLLLVFVLLKGSTQMGAQRWIPIGPFNLQPSEFGRVVIALILAMYFGENRRGAKNTSDLVVGGMFTAVPLLLIAKQPDLGTAVTLIPVFIGVAFLAGLRTKLLGVFVLMALRGALAWEFALTAYQKGGGTTFRDPDQDPRGQGYQQIQGRVTVGSGGLTGKGFMGGTQGQYKFLPVAHNDFIFSVLAEEQGFIGVLAALGLYLFVILRSLEAARLAKDRLGSYLVGGIISGFAFQVIYNVTMSAGLAPVKGITLPLMSYGGSSLIATLAGFGLILNVRMRRFTN